mmetsp:Transcript_29319/g.62852  ORF Transcript_29319/g.62852 Transcript_29319/m.62852 type:complete len:220 (+) Transcript_29319:386-1045(+)
MVAVGPAEPGKGLHHRYRFAPALARHRGQPVGHPPRSLQGDPYPDRHAQGVPPPGDLVAFPLGQPRQPRVWLGSSHKEALRRKHTVAVVVVRAATGLGSLRVAIEGKIGDRDRGVGGGGGIVVATASAVQGLDGARQAPQEVFPMDAQIRQARTDIRQATATDGPRDAQHGAEVVDDQRGHQRQEIDQQCHLVPAVEASGDLGRDPLLRSRCCRDRGCR